MKTLSCIRIGNSVVKCTAVTLTVLVLCVWSTPSAGAATLAAVWAGGNGNWTADNWGLSGDFPNNGVNDYDVTINAAGTYQVTLNTAPTINSLLIDNSGATLYTNNQSLNVLGAINVANGQFRLHADPTITATTFTNGSGGTVIVNPTANPQTHVTMNIANAIENNGLFKVQSGFGWLGELAVTGAAKINNNASATLHFDITPGGGGTTFSRLSADIDNSGTVTVTRGVTLFKAGGVYRNLTAGASWTLNQAINITGSGSTFTQSNGTINNTAGMTFTSASGASKYELSGGTLNNAGGLTLIGTGSEFEQTGGSITGGVVKVGAEGLIDLQTGTHTAGTTFYAEGVTSISANPATVVSIGAGYNGGNFDANLTARGKVDITGNFNTVTAGKTFQVGENVSPNLQTSVTVPGALTNHGTIRLSNQTFGWGTTLTVPGVLTNAADGLIELLDPNYATTGGLRRILAELNNAGTFRVDNLVKLGQLGQSGNQHVNSGTFLVEQDGVLALSGAGYTQSAGTTIVDGQLNYGSNTFSLNGGSLEGAGSLTGNVNATGAGSGLTISPGSSTESLNITGNVVLDANDTIRIELGGTNQGVTLNGYDLLTISGNLTLNDATLEVILLNNFDPQGTDLFEVISAGSIVGQFGNLLNGSGNFGKYTFDVSYDGGLVTLSNFAQVPEPSTLWLASLSLLGIRSVVRRRRSALQGRNT